MTDLAARSKRALAEAGIELAAQQGDTQLAENLHLREGLYTGGASTRIRNYMEGGCRDQP